MARSFVGQLVRRQPAQLVVDSDEQVFGATGISLFARTGILGHVAHSTIVNGGPEKSLIEVVLNYRARCRKINDTEGGSKMSWKSIRCLMGKRHPKRKRCTCNERAKGTNNWNNCVGVTPAEAKK